MFYFGNGDGTFATTPTQQVFPSASNAIFVADGNGDGKLDLLINDYYSTQVLIGNGDGTFTTLPGDTQLSGTWSVLAADFNGDGRPDLSVGTNDGISILLTQPTQTATATAPGIAPSGPAPHLVDASYSGDSNYQPSVSSTASLLVQLSAPVIAPSSGTYISDQSVTITDEVPGATIYYTTDGSMPNTGSPVNTGALTVSSSETVTAIAMAPGYSASATTSATYSIYSKPTITWGTPAAISYGIPLSTTQLNASAGVAGTFTYSPGVGTVLGAGVQTLAVTFTPTDTLHYRTSIQTVTLTVNKALLSVTVDNQSMLYHSSLPALAGTLSGVVPATALRPVSEQMQR